MYRSRGNETRLTVPASGFKLASMIVSVRNRLPLPHQERMSEPSRRILVMPLGSSIDPTGPKSVGSDSNVRTSGVGIGVSVGISVGSKAAVGGMGWKGVGVAVASGGASSSGGRAVSVGGNTGSELGMPIAPGMKQADSVLANRARINRRFIVDIDPVSSLRIGYRRFCADGYEFRHHRGRFCSNRLRLCLDGYRFCSI